MNSLLNVHNAGNMTANTPTSKQTMKITFSNSSESQLHRDATVHQRTNQWIRHDAREFARRDGMLPIHSWSPASLFGVAAVANIRAPLDDVHKI
jgi:hypothetical protein